MGSKTGKAAKPARNAALRKTGSGKAKREIAADAGLFKLELLGQLAVICLRGASESEMLDAAAEAAAEGLGARFSEAAEYLPEENRLLVRAGVGWPPGIVGVCKLDGDVGSPAGFVLRTEQAVVCNNLADENVFRTPALWREHGIKRTITVALKGDGAPFGVLEVDSDRPGEFSVDDLPFVQSAAHVVGVAIERLRAERRVRSELEWQKVVCDEMNHRIKNSLQLVATSLLLDAGTSGSDEMRFQLQEASCRVAAVARVHEHLSKRPTHDRIELRPYLVDLCQALSASGLPCQTDLAAAAGLTASADLTLSLGLVAAELVTNAFKHGARVPGLKVALRTVRDAGDLVVSVADNGPGLPPGFDPRRSRQLGFRIIQHLVAGMNATLEIASAPGGTEIRLRLPLRALNGDASG